MHDLLPKHSTVDICDGISDAVEEFSHHPGINQTRQATEKGMYQQKWEQIQQKKCGASTGQNGWIETLLCGISTVGRGCNARIEKKALAYQGSRVKV